MGCKSIGPSIDLCNRLMAMSVPKCIPVSDRLEDVLLTRQCPCGREHTNQRVGRMSGRIHVVRPRETGASLKLEESNRSTTGR